MAGLAHPAVDNAHLNGSDVHSRDDTFIHHFDHMVEAVGGNALARRWEGDWEVDGQTIYFVFTAPQFGPNPEQ